MPGNAEDHTSQFPDAESIRSVILVNVYIQVSIHKAFQKTAIKLECNRELQASFTHSSSQVERDRLLP